MQIKLITFLTRSLGISRRQVADIITSGSVMVNDEICVSYSQSIDTAADIITYQNKTIKWQGDEYRYYLYYKPRGLEVTREKINVALQKLNIDTTGISYAGRLDLDSEGMLLLSDDGMWLQNITHPSTKVPKTYIVIVSGYKGEYQIRALRSEFDSVSFKKLNDNHTQLAMVLHEGKNRQIRKACTRAGLHVIRLKRIGIGELFMPKELRAGEYYPLSASDLEKLGIK